MRRKWPSFRVLHRTARTVCWQGQLRPLSQVYTVQVFLRLEQKDNSDRSFLPVCVTVMKPMLRRRIEAPNEPIPHHYPNPHRPDLPLLCLYDPAAHEWDRPRVVANTVVPWTIDWLACYEGWLATGEWAGGGRHPEAG